MTYSRALPQSLSIERLQKIVGVIATSRAEASDRQDYEFGDDAQVLGMRAYKSIVKTLTELAGTDGFEWLSCHEPRGRFTLMIGDCPVRFWREEDPDLEAEERRLLVAIAASHQLSMFEKDALAVDRWAIIYQTGFGSQVDTAMLVGYNSASREALIQEEIEVQPYVPVGLVEVNAQLEEAVKLEKAGSALKLKKAAEVKGKQQEG